MPAYAELAVTTNFSFLRGASHPQEYVAQAAALGLKAIGIADRNTMAGVVRAYSEWKNHKDTLKLLVGTRLVTTDGFEAIAYPIDRDAYGRLCRLLSTGNRRAKKGECLFGFDEILAAAQGQIFIAVPPPRPSRSFTERLTRLLHAAPSRTYLAAVHRYRSDEPRRLGRLAEFAERAKVPLVAVSDALYHVPERRPPAGRGHLHPREMHHSRGRPAAREAMPNGISRAREEMARLFAGLSRRGRPHGRDRGSLQLLPRRAEIRIPRGAGPARQDRRSSTSRISPGATPAGATKGRSRRGSRSSCATSSP